MTETAKVARFSLDGRIYTSAMIDEIPLRDVLVFASQAKDIGLDVTWDQIEELADRMAGAGKDDKSITTQDELLITAAMIWASRRVAGDDVTFGEAIDVPMNRIVFLPATEDHRPDPSKARKPKGKSRKGSGPRAEGAPQTPAADEDTTTSETSEQPSADD